MAFASSPYLNLRVRPLSEVERDVAMNGGYGSAADEQIDSLQYLLDRTKALFAEFAVRNGKDQLGKIDIAYEMGGLSDVISDLEGRLEEMIDRERSVR